MKYLKIRSKNHTANALRKVISTGDKDIVLRLGSTTPIYDIFPKIPNEDVIEINSSKACLASGNKFMMKVLFDKHEVPTARWCLFCDVVKMEMIKYPLIIKHINSSKGKGIYYIPDKESMVSFVTKTIERYGNDHLKNYIIEEYKTYNKEYRLHVTKEGCFYTCRKMLKSDAKDRWHRHNNNSVWILEENPLFNKPENWDKIVEASVLAIKSVGLDIGAVDVKVQSDKEMGKEPKFIILETNSAPSLGEITTKKYIEQLTKMVNNYVKRD